MQLFQSKFKFIQLSQHSKFHYSHIQPGLTAVQGRFLRVFPYHNESLHTGHYQYGEAAYTFGLTANRALHFKITGIAIRENIVITAILWYSKYV